MPESEALEVRAIYVHVPFCRKLGRESDAAVTPLQDDSLASWLAALRAEWKAVKELEGIQIEPLESLYVGGGPPSVLGERAMAGLRDLLGERLLGGGTLEWTAEASPEDLTPELARAWSASGVNRISLGVQSFQVGALDWLARSHGAEASARAIEAARRAGIENINVDLAFGLPKAVEHDAHADLERTLELAPPHVTLQEVMVEPDAPLAARGKNREEEEVAPHVGVEEAYLHASQLLRDVGYAHYEVSCFARAGYEPRHPYLSGVPYLGLGNSAHSYLPPRRCWNLADWRGYCSAARSGTLWKETGGEREEVLTGEQRRLESLWLGLRSRRGVRRDALPGDVEALVGRWVREGLAEDEPDVVRLTPRGWLHLDDLVGQLDRTFPA